MEPELRGDLGGRRLAHATKFGSSLMKLDCEPQIVVSGRDTSTLLDLARFDNARSEHHSFGRMDWRDLETFSFGDGPELANRLLELVLSGTKCATCWAESQGLLSTAVDKMMVVLDGQGVPRAILRTIELTKRRFNEVDEAFAYDEGEGDRSLQDRREAHKRYFERVGRYAPDMMLWCERFELIERIG